MVTATREPEIETAAAPDTATRLALVVEYDGTLYCGFQLQADRPTVQAELEKALRIMTGERVRIAASSRTDAGVHARAQVVTFKTTRLLDMDAYTFGLNHHLPDDIAVKAVYRVPLSFNARRSAVSREYTYSILNTATRSPLASRFAHRVAGKMDVAVMNAASQVLLGTHDFASFASNIGDEPERSTVRRVYEAAVTRHDDMVDFRIIANAFVRHQVRSTAGALVQVGLGRMTVQEFERLLEAKQPGLAGPLLPACGLCLMRVNYPFNLEEMRS